MSLLYAKKRYRLKLRKAYKMLVVKYNLTHQVFIGLAEDMKKFHPSNRIVARICQCNVWLGRTDNLVIKLETTSAILVPDNCICTPLQIKVKTKIFV